MLELFAASLSGWRTVLHISEWTGLSVGALAALAALVYLRPALLKPALAVAIVLAVGYAGTIYGDKTGRTDLQKQWDDARQAAIAAEQERDAMAEQNLERKYAPKLAELQAQAAKDKDQADAYERTIAELAKDAGGKGGARGACDLGALADRLWPRK